MRLSGGCFEVGVWSETIYGDDCDNKPKLKSPYRGGVVIGKLDRRVEQQFSGSGELLQYFFVYCDR